MIFINRSFLFSVSLVTLMSNSPVLVGLFIIYVYSLVYICYQERRGGVANAQDVLHQSVELVNFV